MFILSIAKKFEYFPKALPVITKKSMRRSHEMHWQPFFCPQETFLRPLSPNCDDANEVSGNQR
jgi:hypothetical protein